MTDSARERAEAIAADSHAMDITDDFAFSEHQIAAALAAERERICARLESPSEAMVEAAARPHCENDWPCRMCQDNARASFRALAATLREEE